MCNNDEKQQIKTVLSEWVQLSKGKLPEEKKEFQFVQQSNTQVNAVYKTNND